MNGILVIDKPVGPTSFDMVARVRRAAGEKRVGHAGTLDPLASGVLVLCLGEATKLVPYLMDADKEYLATMCLGSATDTDDADPKGKVIFRADPAVLAKVTEDHVRRALASQVGQIVQRPPTYSALKVGGERLYDLARNALTQPEEEASVKEAAQAKARPVQIDQIVLHQICLPEVVFQVRCGKGTYIRSIARDVGEALGVGGHLTALRRLRVGTLDLAKATPLLAAPDRFASPQQILSMEEALQHLPQVSVSEQQAARLRNGQKGVLAEIAALLSLREAPYGVVLDPKGRLAALLAPCATGLEIGRVFHPLPTLPA